MPVKISNLPVNPQALRQEAISLGKEIEAATKAQQGQPAQEMTAVDKMESSPRVESDVQAKAKQLQNVLGELAKVFLPSMMQSVMKGLPAAALQALESVKGPIGPLPQAIRDVNRRLYDFEAKFRTELDAFHLDQSASLPREQLDRAQWMLRHDTKDAFFQNLAGSSMYRIPQESSRGLWDRLTNNPPPSIFDRERANQEIAEIQDAVRTANAKLKDKYPHIPDAMLIPVPFDEGSASKPRAPETHELMRAMREANPEYVALKKEQAELMGLFREEHGLSAENLVKAREKQLDPARTLGVIHTEALALVNSLDAMAEKNGPAKETLTTKTSSASGSTSTSARYLGSAPNDEGRLSIRTGETVSSSSGSSSSTSTSQALLGEGRHFTFQFLPRPEEETSMTGRRFESGAPMKYSRAERAGPRTLFADEAPVLADKLLTLLRLLEEAQYKYPGMAETRDLQNWVANTTFDVETLRPGRSSGKGAYTLARFRDELCQGNGGYGPSFVNGAERVILADEINAPLTR